jgi:hypothetical protein
MKPQQILPRCFAGASAIIAASIVLIACNDGSFQDITAPQARKVALKRAHSDWFDCVYASFSNGSEVYSCTSESHTLPTVTVYGEYPDDWNGDAPENTCQSTNGCDPWDLCPSAGSCGQGTSGGPGAPGTADPQDDAPLLEPPDCTKSNNPVTVQAWCSGRQPTPNETYKITNALNAMRNRGGICATLADIGFHYLNNGTLHMIDGTFWKMGGTAPRYGGLNAYLAIDWAWTERFYDADHTTTVDDHELIVRDLQQVLAHELDHLNGEDHVHDTGTMKDNFSTPNSSSCGNL